jgi:DNA-binding HxlR family transcriptional regulator
VRRPVAQRLSQRLAELRESRIVESGDGGYRLTGVGRRLLAALTPLNEWAKAWAESLRE